MGLDLPEPAAQGRKQGAPWSLLLYLRDSNGVDPAIATELRSDLTPAAKCLNREEILHRRVTARRLFGHVLINRTEASLGENLLRLRRKQEVDKRFDRLAVAVLID